MIEKGKRIRDDFDNWQCNGRQNATKAYPRRAHVKFQISIKCTHQPWVAKSTKKIMYIKHTNKQEAQWVHFNTVSFLSTSNIFFPFIIISPTSLSHVFSIVHFNFGLLRVKKENLNILNKRKRDYLFAWLLFKAVQSLCIYKGTPTEKKRRPYHKEKIKIQCLILYFSFTPWMNGFIDLI